MSYRERKGFGVRRLQWHQKTITAGLRSCINEARGHGFEDKQFCSALHWPSNGLAGEEPCLSLLFSRFAQAPPSSSGAAADAALPPAPSATAPTSATSRLFHVGTGLPEDMRLPLWLDNERLAMVPKPVLLAVYMLYPDKKKGSYTWHACGSVQIHPKPEKAVGGKERLTLFISMAEMHNLPIHRCWQWRITVCVTAVGECIHISIRLVGYLRLGARTTLILLMIFSMCLHFTSIT